jgi:hypothetical protein
MYVTAFALRTENAPCKHVNILSVPALTWKTAYPTQITYLIKPLVASNGLPCLYSCGHHLGCRVVTPWGRQSVRAHNSTLESAV